MAKTDYQAEKAAMLIDRLNRAEGALNNVEEEKKTALSMHITFMRAIIGEVIKSIEIGHKIEADKEQRERERERLDAERKSIEENIEKAKKEKDDALVNKSLIEDDREEERAKIMAGEDVEANTARFIRHNEEIEAVDRKLAGFDNLVKGLQNITAKMESAAAGIDKLNNDIADNRAKNDAQLDNLTAAVEKTEQGMTEGINWEAMAGAQQIQANTLASLADRLNAAKDALGGNNFGFEERFSQIEAAVRNIKQAVENNGKDESERNRLRNEIDGLTETKQNKEAEMSNIIEERQSHADNKERLTKEQLVYDNVGSYDDWDIENRAALEERRYEIDRQIENENRQITESENKLASVKGEVENTSDEIFNASEKIEKLNSDIQNSINQNGLSIESLTESIKALEKDVDKEKSERAAQIAAEEENKRRRAAMSPDALYAEDYEEVNKEWLTEAKAKYNTDLTASDIKEMAYYEYGTRALFTNLDNNISDGLVRTSEVMGTAWSDTVDKEFGAALRDTRGAESAVKDAQESYEEQKRDFDGRWSKYQQDKKKLEDEIKQLKDKTAVIEKEKQEYFKKHEAAAVEAGKLKDKGAVKDEDIEKMHFWEKPGAKRDKKQYFAKEQESKDMVAKFVEKERENKANLEEIRRKEEELANLGKGLGAEGVKLEGMRRVLEDASASLNARIKDVNELHENSVLKVDLHTLNEKISSKDRAGRMQRLREKTTGQIRNTARDENQMEEVSRQEISMGARRRNH